MLIVRMVEHGKLPIIACQSNCPYCACLLSSPESSVGRSPSIPSPSDPQVTRRRKAGRRNLAFLVAAKPTTLIETNSSGLCFLDSKYITTNQKKLQNSPNLRCFFCGSQDMNEGNLSLHFLYIGLVP